MALIFYHTFDGHQEQVWDLAFSPDGSYLVSGSLDGVVNLWEIESDPGQDSSCLGESRWGGELVGD
ncbi:WD40 repeat domain-containing protein [Sodalinema gerasimenkoae]|uniref:WD40 repeat domain-containing protein n=1 Tax=Sodalinema gerasimenkoae TaxID=2862348 RepID=UPI00135B12BB